MQVLVQRAGGQRLGRQQEGLLEGLVEGRVERRVEGRVEEREVMVAAELWKTSCLL